MSGFDMSRFMRVYMKRCLTELYEFSSVCALLEYNIARMLSQNDEKDGNFKSKYDQNVTES